MKRLILFTICFWVVNVIHAQNPHWAWFKNSNSIYSISSNKVAVDAQQNVYIAGNYSTWMYLDTFFLNSIGHNDVFIAKYDITGNVVWAKSLGSVDDDNAISIVSDANGNIYVAGMFGTSTSFFPNTIDTFYISNQKMVSNGGKDIFIAKYDTNGNLIWVKNFGGIDDDVISGLILNHNQKLLIAGNFGSTGYSPIVNETIQFDSITLTSNGNQDIFLAAIDTNGHTDFAKNYGSSNSEYVTGLQVDSFDNIILSGWYFSSFSIDTFNLPVISNVWTSRNLFTAKFDSIGKALWVRNVGVLSSLGGYASSSGGQIIPIKLAVSPTGNVYLVGYLNGGLMKFDDNSALAYNNFGSNFFMIKYDLNGNKTWSHFFYVNNNIAGISDIWINQNNELFITGGAIAPATNNDSITGYSNNDVFINKCDESSNSIWNLYMGGLGTQTSNAIVGDQYGNLYVTGVFNSYPLHFGNNEGWGNGSSVPVIFLTKLSMTTGIPTIATSPSDWQLYPNPTTGVIHLQSNKENFSSIKVIDQLGRVLEEQNIYQNQTSIDLHTLPDGIYYVEFLGKNHTQTKKVIIEH